MPNPMILEPQEQYNDFVLSGTAHLRESPDQPPTTIIKTSQAWGIDVELNTVGSLCYALTGHWHADLYLESIGPGTDYRFSRSGGPSSQDELIRQSSANYQFPINVSAGQVQVGTYRATVRVILHNPDDVPLPVTAFAEGPVINVFTSV